MKKVIDRRRKKPIYIDLIYDEKDEAKKLGAWWDKELRLWYIPPFCKKTNELLEKFDEIFL